MSPAKDKSPKNPSVVEKCFEFETDKANEGADITVLWAYCAATKVGQSTVAPKGTFKALKDASYQVGFGR